MNKLVLFDIDGTLIKGKHGHPQAFSDAFKIVYKIKNLMIDWEGCQGMTDKYIIIKTLKDNKIDVSIIFSKIKDCMDEMINSFNKSIVYSNIKPFNGVIELLNKLNKKEIILGLVTGNLKDIAKLKLEKVGIWQYFKVGGFGSDDINRTNLVKIAIDKSKKFNFEFKDNVYLFGDTPSDIQAGKEAGVKTIGVATGVHSKEELIKANANFVVENLKDTKKILKILDIT